MDVTLALLALLLLWPVALAVALAILLLDGAPVLYGARRMRDAETPFTLWKFRTMRPDPADIGVTGADKADRITRSGRVLRRHRLDELPQILNILQGDMSIVGPRPPLPQYVAEAPDLYAKVLQSRPGITGLATLIYHRHEQAILARCTTEIETHETYLRQCVPAKARLDLIYQRNRSLCFDAAILLKTLSSLIRHR
jgi:lipopolysaccharide/colanic/teichoic acid biosynthesis glycosyltransferase